MSDYELPPLPPSVAQVIDRINTDPTTRIRLISRLVDALIDLGVNADELHIVGSNVVAEESDPASREVGERFVFIDTHDSSVNRRSIIVA